MTTKLEKKAEEYTFSVPSHWRWITNIEELKDDERPTYINGEGFKAGFVHAIEALQQEFEDCRDLPQLKEHAFWAQKYIRFLKQYAEEDEKS